jgi:hypothetical protein
VAHAARPGDVLGPVCSLTCQPAADQAQVCRRRVGKFAVTDMFDNNKYTHDPRADFLNWALIDTGTFDYAADAWGYTYGAAVEWYQGQWTLRAGLIDLSVVPNSSDLDPTFVQQEWIGDVAGQPSKIAVTAFLTQAAWPVSRTPLGSPR